MQTMACQVRQECPQAEIMCQLIARPSLLSGLMISLSWVHIFILEYIEISPDMLGYHNIWYVMIVYIYIYISRYGMISLDMVDYDKIYLSKYFVRTLYLGYPNATQNVPRIKRSNGTHLPRTARNDMWTQPHKERRIRSHLTDLVAHHDQELHVECNAWQVRVTSGLPLAPSPYSKVRSVSYNETEPDYAIKRGISVKTDEICHDATWH
jgi:hypothetical protein